MPSLLLKGATILTQDAQRRIVRGDVRVEDGLITHVGDAPRAADEVIECEGDLLLPGLVNAHTHSPMTLFRGLGDDLPLEEWLRTRIWPAEKHLTRDDVAAGTELALIEMARTGTTAFCDMYFFADATAEASERAGMRAHVASAFIDFQTPEMGPADMEPRARRFIERWRKSELVTPTLSPHATYTCSDETLATVRKLRDETGALVTTHCCETRFEVQDVLAKRGARPIELLRRAGLLDGALLAHCGWVTKDEIRLMREHGASAAHCPVSNLKLATGGTMPWEEMLAEGVNVALGTDGAASNNTLDVLETAKFAALIQKQHRWDARAGRAQDVLDAATLGGRRALRMPAKGIEPGARADIILISTKAPHMTPIHDAVSAVVYAARGSDVRATIVAGRIIYLDGAWRTMDASGVMRRARERGARLAKLAAL